MIALLAALVLAENLFSLDLGIDWSTLHRRLVDQNPHPGRMAPNAALAFLLSAATLIPRAPPTKANSDVLGHLLPATVVALGVTGVAGNALRLDMAYAWFGVARMAMPTAIGFILLGSALWMDQRQIRDAAPCTRSAGEGPIYAFLGVALTILFAIAAVSYGSINALQDRARVIAHTFEVRLQFDELLAEYRKVRIGHRSYLIDGADAHLRDFEAAVDALSSQLQLTRQLIADNPIQQARLAAIEHLLDLDLATVKADIPAKRDGNFRRGEDALPLMNATRFNFAEVNRLGKEFDDDEAKREKRHIICNDIASDATMGPLRDDARACGYRSVAALPLLIEGKAGEVLVLLAGEADFFDAEEVTLLIELTADLSFALDYLAKEARLDYVSYYDTLTGLANRQLFFDRLTQLIHSANSDQHAGVIVVDLKRFRTINDTLGRSAGDTILKQFATRLQQNFGRAATTARISGDRFAVAVTNVGSPSLAFRLDEWIAGSHAQPMIIDGMELRVSFKIGIAFFPTDGGDAESLFHNAEAALQRAKDTTDTYVFYSPEMNARVAERLNLESRLRKAVEQNQFLLHYQPKVDLKTRRILGFEALMRWRDSDNKFVSPLDFIPILEKTGMIVDAGRWVIEQVVADIGRWRSQKLDVPRVAVNVSQVQVRQKDFVATVLSALGDKRDRGSDVDLEITESLVMEDSPTSIEKLDQLRAAGMRIFMDDFGTGYSSLSQIAALPLDALKIDRAFVAGMGKKAEAIAIVSTIISLARALKIGVVAEGVETEEQAALLMSLGCDQAQGYLFSRPVPFDEIALLLSLERTPA